MKIQHKIPRVKGISFKFFFNNKTDYTVMTDRVTFSNIHQSISINKNTLNENLISQ